MDMTVNNGCAVVFGLILSAVILATVPLVLDIVSRLLRAHYRRVMWARSVEPHDAPAIANGTSNVPLIAASEVPDSHRPARDEAAAEKWLREHRAAIEGDARYPENPAFCSDDAWQRAFLPLARGADVVLMDVRDFDLTHEGCVFELRTLRDEKRLPRVVFLANERTDRKAIAELLDGHEIKMLDFGRRTDDERHALFNLLLTAAYA